MFIDLFVFHEYIDKATVSFCNRFGSCVAATGGIDILNTPSKYRVSYKHQPFMI